MITTTNEKQTLNITQIWEGKGRKRIQPEKHDPKNPQLAEQKHSHRIQGKYTISVIKILQRKNKQKPINYYKNAQKTAWM